MLPPVHCPSHFDRQRTRCYSATPRGGCDHSQRMNGFVCSVLCIQSRIACDRAYSAWHFGSTALRPAYYSRNACVPANGVWNSALLWKNATPINLRCRVSPANPVCIAGKTRHPTIFCWRNTTSLDFVAFFLQTHLNCIESYENLRLLHFL